MVRINMLHTYNLSHIETNEKSYCSLREQ